jgi:SAM-dependent methyltransferase
VNDPYDALVDVYDPWTADVRDVQFYVDMARESGGPIVELGIGTGRVAIPTAKAGVRVIGIDASERMIERCLLRSREAGVADLIDARVGDFRQIPIRQRVPLVTCPFESFSHLLTDEDRVSALTEVREILQPHGTFVFDIATRGPEQPADAEVGWQEAPGGLERRFEWDWAARRRHVLLRFRAEGGFAETRLTLAWLSRDEWRDAIERSDLRVEACYGSFNRSPCGSSTYTIFVTGPKIQST